MSVTFRTTLRVALLIAGLAGAASTRVEAQHDRPPHPALRSRLRLVHREVTTYAPEKPGLRADDSWLEGRDIVYRDRLSQGYTVVLPGVLGTTPYNSKLIRLLEEGCTAVEYFDWTDGVPLFSRRGLRKNHYSTVKVENLVQRITEYQDHYPGRPVYVIALCAGAGPACEAIAALPASHRIERAILLGPALSPNYDLRPALSGTQQGIDSFHSPLDVPVLMGLTTVVGTVDGQHMPAAGAVGFVTLTRKLPSLRQHMYNPKMLMQGHLGGHFGWTATKFVRSNVLPLLRQSSE